MLGLQTALSVTVTELVDGGVLDLPAAVAKLSTNPAASRDLGGHGGPIQPGAPANLCVFDPSAEWTVTTEQLVSRSRNTPFAGWRLRGRVVHTILRGRMTVRDGVLAGDRDADDDETVEPEVARA
jgi:dihydroorotase